MTTATRTTTLTVNAAFLQELKEVNQDLWKLLAQCESSAAHLTGQLRCCGVFAKMLRDLRDDLAMHFALEEAYGYFEDPLTVPPRLAQRAADLRAEHCQLYLALSALVEEAERLLYERRLSTFAATVRDEFQLFHSRLQDHESREIELIHETYEEDIGEGD